MMFRLRPSTRIRRQRFAGPAVMTAPPAGIRSASTKALPVEVWQSLQ
jgi:hypothetical protein